jgi:hypothetical protein
VFVVVAREGRRRSIGTFRFLAKLINERGMDLFACIGVMSSGWKYDSWSRRKVEACG